MRRRSSGEKSFRSPEGGRGSRWKSRASRRIRLFLPRSPGSGGKAPKPPPAFAAPAGLAAEPGVGSSTARGRPFPPPAPVSDPEAWRNGFEQPKLTAPGRPHRGGRAAAGGAGGGPRGRGRGASAVPTADPASAQPGPAPPPGPGSLHPHPSPSFPPPLTEPEPAARRKGFRPGAERKTREPPRTGTASTRPEEPLGGCERGGRDGVGRRVKEHR